MNTPIFEALGQPAPGGLKAVSLASWAGVQTPSPAPTEGFSETPLGSCTVIRLTSAWVRSRGLAKPSFSL